jgi:hypothetical protein
MVITSDYFVVYLILHMACQQAKENQKCGIILLLQEIRLEGKNGS